MAQPVLRAAPTNQGYVYTSRQPKVMPTANGERVVHRERLCATPVVATSNGYAKGLYPFGAGNENASTKLPWLLARSAFYSKYRVNRLRYIYEPIVGTNSSAQIVMGLFRDPVDGTSFSIGTPSEANHRGLEQCVPATYSPCWQRAVLEVTGPQLHTSVSYFDVAKDVVSSEVAARFNVPCSLGVSVFDPPGSNTSHGSIYVEYDITFFDPTSNVYGVAAPAPEPVVPLAPQVSVQPKVGDAHGVTPMDVDPPAANPTPIYNLATSLFYEEYPVFSRLDRPAGHKFNILCALQMEFDNIVSQGRQFGGFVLNDVTKPQWLQARVLWQEQSSNLVACWESLEFTNDVEILRNMLYHFIGAVSSICLTVFNVAVGLE